MRELDRNIIEQINEMLNLDLLAFDEEFLLSMIKKRMIATNHQSPETYFQLLADSPEEIELLHTSLQVGYSEFFRNPLTFATLEQIVLPALLLAKRNVPSNEIRAWSAACAAGQEAYSVAMLLEELKSGNNIDLRYRIFATDLSEKILGEAQLGKYTSSALKNMSLKRVEHWFTKSGDYYAVDPGLKRNIDFSAFDLLDPTMGCPAASIFGSFDLAFCANILFYYQPKQQKIILDKIVKCLSLEGYIVTGEIEREILLKLGFNEMFPHSAIFRK
jgi:chemotaxis methyl-accepting protein methylase